MIFLQILLLVLGVSLDAFGAGVTYGIGKVRLPVASVWVMSVVSALVLAFSLCTGRLFLELLPQGAGKIIGFLVLFVLGVVKLFDQSSEEWAKRAERNRDCVLSPLEALVLGISLSLDSLGAGLSMGGDSLLLFWAVPGVLLITFGLMELGQCLGGILAGKVGNCYWISGVLLLFLAFLRLV